MGGHSMHVLKARPGWVSVGVLASLLAAASAEALDPSRRISQYGHTAWRMQDGYFTGAPNAIAQTADGYLWIGTQSGLVRFDGVRFMPWTPPPGKRLPSTTITALLAARDGSLWIGTYGGLSHWVHGDLITYPDSAVRVNAILEDRQGAIWIARTEATYAAPFCQVIDIRLRCYGKDDGVPQLTGVALAEDPDGSLWIGGEQLLHWKAGAITSYTRKGVQARMDGIGSLAGTSTGALWVGMARPGLGLGLQRLMRGEWKPFVTPTFDSSTLEVVSLHLDRDEALWIGATARGIYRIQGNEVDHFGTENGLSGDFVSQFYQDREGTLWAATSGGLDSFRDMPVASFSIREGLSTTEVDSVLASRDGTIWIASAGALDALRRGRVTALRNGKGLPGFQVTSLLEDRAGRLWVGLDEKLTVYANGRFRSIDMPDGSPVGLVVGITEDVHGDIWIEITGSPRKLIRIQGLTVRDVFPAPGMPEARRIAADPAGGIWLGLLSGGLARLRDGALDVVPFAHGPAPNDETGVNHLVVNADGSVLGATASGLVAWRDGTPRTLTVRNGLPCDRVHTFIADREGALWLYAECGLVKIEKAQLDAWWRQPDVTVKTSLLDALDGARAARAPFVAATESPDGRLWFANGKAVQTIDPLHVTRNMLPPPVYVEAVVANRRRYAPMDGLQLPPLTRDLEITYTALSLAVPQKVRFRYQLEGHDADWVDPGTRRQAFYTDLRPGRYRFRVVASNNDEIWNEAGATLTFSVAPAWYQTVWFRIVATAFAVSIVWAVYRLRVRQIAAALGARFDERLTERTRLARELHDTLLQTIQASKLVADDALVESGNAAGLQLAVARLSEWLGQAVQEGRAALNSLRSSTTTRNDLAEGLRQAADDCVQGAMEIAFFVDGESREMHPIARDEVFRTGYEAIRNACRHSTGRRLDIELIYGADLTLRIRDDGSGMDPVVVKHGRSGHFGISGMRDRAAAVGGTLTIVSAIGAGTEITLVVPGRIIYRTVK